MADLTKKPKILFFTKSGVATKEEMMTGGNIPHARVQYRNSLQIRKNDAVEECDGVFGAVPKAYAHLPSAEKAVQAYVDAVAAAKKESGDEEAPKASSVAKDRPDISEASKKKSKKSKAK